MWFHRWHLHICTQYHLFHFKCLRLLVYVFQSRSSCDNISLNNCVCVYYLTPCYSSQYGSIVIHFRLNRNTRVSRSHSGNGKYRRKTLAKLTATGTQCLRGIPPKPEGFQPNKQVRLNPKTRHVTNWRGPFIPYKSIYPSLAEAQRQETQQHNQREADTSPGEPKRKLLHAPRVSAKIASFVWNTAGFREDLVPKRFPKLNAGPDVKLSLSRKRYAQYWTNRTGRFRERKPTVLCYSCEKQIFLGLSGVFIWCHTALFAFCFSLFWDESADARIASR